MQKILILVNKSCRLISVILLQISKTSIKDSHVYIFSPQVTINLNNVIFLHKLFLES